MVNKKRGEISIELGGRERVLKLTLNDFAELQDRYNDMPLIDILAKLDKMDVKVLRALLYLAVKHDDKDLTENQVGAFEFNLTEVATKLGECIAAALGGDSKPGKKK
jgi:hypothetical protein